MPSCWRSCLTCRQAYTVAAPGAKRIIQIAGRDRRVGLIAHASGARQVELPAVQLAVGPSHADRPRQLSPPPAAPGHAPGVGIWPLASSGRPAR